MKKFVATVATAMLIGIPTMAIANHNEDHIKVLRDPVIKACIDMLAIKLGEPRGPDIVTQCVEPNTPKGEPN